MSLNLRCFARHSGSDTPLVPQVSLGIQVAAVCSRAWLVAHDRGVEPAGDPGISQIPAQPAVAGVHDLFQFGMG